MTAIATKQRLHGGQGPLLIALEPRYLFDGAGAVTVVDASHHTNPFITSASGPDPLAQALATHVLPTDPTAGVSTPIQVKAADPSQTGGKKEVAFVDTSVSDWQALANGLPAGVEVELIGGGDSGLAQMAKWAESHSGYDSIHILSQGSEGTLRLGSDTLTDASLSNQGVQAELAEIGHALNARGEVLLYGSSIGAGSDGQAFVADLAADTGTVVTAADHVVGNASQGGSWTLDVTTDSAPSSVVTVPGYLGSLGIGDTVTDPSPLTVQVSAADPGQNGGKTEVAFVETSVIGWQSLVTDIRSSRPGVEVELIDGTQSGLAGIANWAQTHSGYDAIHVLSHGAEATLYLGTDTVTDGSLAVSAIQNDFAEIGQALRPGGDLLVYGCDVAAGRDGQQFITDLAAESGAIVAASTDNTGAASLGGNWRLEASTGTIETAAIDCSDFQYLLPSMPPTISPLPPNGAAPVLNAGFSVGTGTEGSASIGGGTVASYLGTNATDAASHTLGIAVTAADAGWQFYDGTTWYSFQRHVTMGTSNALLLNATTLIRYVPSTYYNGTANFTFQAWDQTEQGNNQQGNNLTNLGIGGTGPISTASKTATATVTAVNSTPTASSSLDVASFGGSSQYFQGPALTIGGAFTFEAWVNVASYTTWGRFWDIGNGAGDNNILVAENGR